MRKNMNKKIKKILSVFLILALLGTAYAATNVALTSDKYTGCVTTYNTPKGTLYYVKAGDTPLYTCRAGDYQVNIYDRQYINRLSSTINGKINNIYGQIDNIYGKINNIYSRLTNLENSQNTYIAGDWRYFNFTPTDPMKTIATYTFYLPVDSYVNIQSSAWLNSNNGMTIAMGTDNRPCGDYWCYVDNLRGIHPPYDNFEISNTKYLGKGYHTLYLDAGWSSSTTALTSLYFNVISTQKTLDDTMTSSNIPASINENTYKITYKNGNVTIGG